MYTTVTEIKEANKEAGYHFFDRKTMKFFKSKIESKVIQGKYLIISNMYDEKTKKYMITEALDTGKVNYITFDHFNSMGEARTFLNKYIEQIGE